MIGKTIQNIEIIDLLGKGGMGTVYKGVDVMLHRDVAIKVLHPELLYDEQVTKRFQAEAIMLASLNHTNITSLYNLIKQDGNFMMVMEYVKGRSLDDLLKEKKQFSEEEAIEYTLQALEGLKHAHAKKIIHRDLKLANIMVSSEAVVKVMDFGIARVLGSSRLTSAGRVIGTLEYMSPEQVQGQEGDERSDIYALGTVLYELVAGQVPFKSTSDYDLMTTKINHKPPPLRSFVETNSDMEGILAKAMERNPKQRFQTAEEFQKALIEYRDKNLGNTFKPSIKTAARPVLNMIKTRIAGIASVVLICALLFGVIHKARQNRLSDRSLLNNELPNTNQDLVGEENHQPDQGTILYPETPKIDPKTLPGSTVKEKDDITINKSRRENTEGKVKDGKISEKSQETESNKTVEDKAKKSEEDIEEGTKIEEIKGKKTKDEETKGEDNTKEKIESVSKKINQTGNRIIKDFKDILFDDTEKEIEEKKEQKREPQTVYIQAYTTIYLRLSEDISSQSAKQGQGVNFFIDKDVIVDDLVVIKAGQKLTGRITDVKSAGDSKKGLIELNIYSIGLPGNQSIPLRASTFRIIGNRGEELIFTKGQTFEVQTAQRSKLLIGKK